MALSNWTQIHAHILELEQEGLVTRTFRRLDPQRQQAVLGAILDEAIEKGPTSVNVRMIAERAEVSVGSLYTYFRNREGLLSFAVELCVRFIIDEFTAFRPFLSTMGLRDALEAYLGPVEGIVQRGDDIWLAHGGFVSRIGSDGLVETIAGGGMLPASSATKPWELMLSPTTGAHASLAVDPSGAIVVADPNQQVLLRFAPGGW